jgi:hypothetical protein
MGHRASAVPPVAGQCLPDEVLSLVLAEVPGGKRRGWKVLPHQSKATLGGEGRRRPRLRTVHDFPRPSV